MSRFDNYGDRSASSHRAMWMSTIRETLERTVPLVADDTFDDLLAQLDDIPSVTRGEIASASNRSSAASVRRDAALELRLSGYVDLVTEMLSRLGDRSWPAQSAARTRSGFAAY